MCELPRKNDELDEIFRNAAVPDISDFTGKYYVHKLTGVVPNLRLLGHYKVFYTVDHKVLGYNFVLKPWGYFRVEMGVLEEDNTGFLMLNYDVERNTFIMRKVRDQVRCIEAGHLYLGRFNSLLREKLRFMGYFSLTR